MEGLTFVPKGAFPAAWSDGGHYGGVFLVATQSTVQTAYVYCLAQGSSTVDGTPQRDLLSSPVRVSEEGLSSGALTIALPAGLSSNPGHDPLISELFFDAARGYLWVLYDGGAQADYLQALALDATTGALTEAWSGALPWMGVEGMAVDGDDLYLAIDNNDDSDGVYLLAGFVTAVRLPSAG
jgi:hypothetical protein